MTTNAKHAAALEARHAEVLELRAEISTQAQHLTGLAEQLDDLVDTRQTTALGLVTEDAKAARDRQTAADRAAARNLDHPQRDVGLDWLNVENALGSGQVVAPVSMAAESASAEIRHTLHTWAHRLTRKATAAAREYEQTLADDHGLCALPRPAVLDTTLHDHGLDTTGPLSWIVVRLNLATAQYTNRPDLRALLRDLERCERVARDVIEGPAKTNHPDPCPWCGRHTLVIQHRVPGSDSPVITCDGTHPCVCDYDSCGCHHRPGRHRHTWEHRGRAAHTWTELRNLINSREAAMALETLATDAVARALELHHAYEYLRPAEKCPTPEEHADHHEATEYSPAACTACDPEFVVCAHCCDANGVAIDWPCPTAQALDTTQPTTD